MCRRDAPLTWTDAQAVCDCGHAIRIGDGVIHYTPSDELEQKAEVHARDKEASRYLRHTKFPTQVFRVQRFLAGLPPQATAQPVFELGCGPGPYTRMLLESSYRVVAVDFSVQSLLINRQATLGHEARVCYVQADLNSLGMARESTSLLMMCDFLQHLGDHDVRNAFLAKVFEWLAPGGFFYLSFFSFNIKNYIVGDLHGSFAGGAIRYERLVYNEVVEALPPTVRVESVVPLNIFHGALPDRLASALPGARYLARMISISGRKHTG